MKTLIFLMMLLGSISLGGVEKPIHTHFNENSVVLNTISPAAEAFYSYWLDPFRKTNTCDVTYEQYKEMHNKYLQLSPEDKEVVNNLPAGGTDGDGYKVIDVLKELAIRFNGNKNSDSGSETKLDQTTMIGIVAGVAIFGMSTILIFYILKNNKVIK